MTKSFQEMEKEEGETTGAFEKKSFFLSLSLSLSLSGDEGKLMREKKKKKFGENCSLAAVAAAGGEGI